MLWTQTERLLLFVGQKPSLASLSGKYMVFILPSLFACESPSHRPTVREKRPRHGSTGTDPASPPNAAAVEECGKRFLQSQNVVFAPTLVLAAATSAGVATMYCLTAVRGWGLLGVATGYNVANVLMALGRTAMVLWVNYGQGSAFGWVAGRALAQQAVSGWYHYLQLGVPAVVQICSEWWVFEIITLLAGLLPKTDVEVASVGVLFQLAAVFYMIPMAVQSAAATRVSNELGALNPGKAARAAWICLSIGRSMTVAFAVLLLATRTRVALIFVKGTPRRLGGHPYVVQRVTEAIPVLAAATLNDGVDGVYNGILRGCGLQGRSAAINLLSNWGVGLPLALLLGFVEGQGIVGFWTGMAVSLLVANITYYVITCRIDWEALARKELHMESDLAAASPLLPRAGESEDPERA